MSNAGKPQPKRRWHDFLVRKIDAGPADFANRQTRLVPVFRRLSPRERLAAIATCIIVFALVFYAWIAEPVALRWLEAHGRARQADAEIRKLRGLIERRDTIEKRFQELRGAVTSGNSEQELRVALLSEIDKLAAQCGLTVVSVKPTAIKKQKDFCRYGLELQARCESHKLVEFLFAMHSPNTFWTRISFRWWLDGSNRPLRRRSG